ncbi:MAG TPA: hypothetical protein VK806_03100 [Bacteroidia bacterium]|jgi:hypothetical protein|nr:hypothetical protein [Bacteroidia bacterium]
MRKLKIGLLLFAISMLLITCKKEHIEPSVVNGTPVFYFNGTVNGSPVSLDAGVSNYYMYSSDSQSTAGVYSFIGNLKQVTPAKSNSIEFIINDYRQLAAGAQETNIASSIDTGYYLYNITGVGTPTQDSVTFTPKVITTPYMYTYNFGDGNTITGYGPLPKISKHLYNNPGNYPTSLSIVFDSAATHTASLSDTLNFGTVKNAITAILSYSTDSVDSVHYTVKITGGTKPYKVSWNAGGSATPYSSITHTGVTGTTDIFTCKYSTTSIYRAYVSITDANGITAGTNLNSIPSGADSTYYMNYTLTPSPVANTNGLSNVTIIYTNPSGTVYRSDDSTEAAGSDFHILSVSNYQNNENNQTTKMLHVKFNCTLYNKSGGSITIKNGDAIIAVAYK